MKLNVMLIAMCTLFLVLMKTSAAVVSWDSPTVESLISDKDPNEGKSAACLEFEAILYTNPYKEEIEACVLAFENSYVSINRTRKEVQQNQEEIKRSNSTLADCDLLQKFLQVFVCRNNNDNIKKEIDSLKVVIAWKEIIIAESIKNADIKQKECYDSAYVKEKKRIDRLPLVLEECAKSGRDKETKIYNVTSEQPTVTTEKTTEKTTLTAEDSTTDKITSVQPTITTEETTPTIKQKSTTNKVITPSVSSSQKFKKFEESNKLEKSKESKKSEESNESEESKESKESEED